MVLGLFTWSFSHHRSIRGNFYCFFFGCVSIGGEMVSGLNEAVCHEEPVVSGSKAQSSVVSYSSKTDLTQSQG